MPTTLIVTNDYPPSIGGIESFVGDIVELLDRDVVVLTSAAARPTVDDSGEVEVVRAGRVLLPSSATTRQAVHLLRSRGASRVLFGAAAPLGLMAGALRAAGAQCLVALSHGHETWWATVPGARSLLRRIGDDVDHVSTISGYTATRIAPALSPAARQRMIRLAPPVNPWRFHPLMPARPDSDRRRAIAVGRLVRQKGFDTLLAGWRLVLQSWPPSTEPPELAIVGDGPLRRRLQQDASALDLGRNVRWAGALPRSAVVRELHRADVFVLPMRTRLAGLNPEGLGLAALEAAACGLPVIVGNSGGAPETLQHGRTGFVVDTDPDQLASRLTALLLDPAWARRMGAEGRRFVLSRYGSEAARITLRRALALQDDG